MHSLTIFVQFCIIYNPLFVILENVFILGVHLSVYMRKENETELNIQLDPSHIYKFIIFCLNFD